MQKVSTTHLQRRDVQDWVRKACLPTGNWKLQVPLHTDSSSAKAVASRRGAGKSTRQTQTRMLWQQEHAAANHLRVVTVETESNPADMLTKAFERSKVEEFCAEIGQTEPHAKTVDKKPKEVKKPKKVKFAVEAMEIEPNVAKVKIKSKDAKLRWMQWIEFSKKVESGEWTNCGTRRDH